MMTLEEARSIFDRLGRRLRAAVIGRDEVIESVLIALLSDGHVLLEDFPGSGKTTLAKVLGESIVDDRPEDERGLIEAFRRVQFTPDLLPSDLTGTSIFEPSARQFDFRPGPIFAHVVLADEINRTSPKVQSALLEAMAEKQVTVDNATRPLDDLFFVIATQNPVDLAGTYPLPSPQLDRFLFKIRMRHLDRESELQVLRTIAERGSGHFPEGPVSRGEILGAREAVDAQVQVHPLIHEALVDCAAAIRSDRRVLQGISTRSLVLALPALKARAMLHDRDFVSAEDLAALLPLVLGHRVSLGAASMAPDEIVDLGVRVAVDRLSTMTLTGGAG